MVFCKLVQPAFKVIHFMFFELCYQFFKNHHYTILCLFGVFQVFETYPVDQIHISLVQIAKYGEIVRVFILHQQFFVGECGLRYVFQKRQRYKNRNKIAGRVINRRRLKYFLSALCNVNCCRIPVITHT